MRSSLSVQSSASAVSPARAPSAASTATAARPGRRRGRNPTAIPRASDPPDRQPPLAAHHDVERPAVEREPDDRDGRKEERRRMLGAARFLREGGRGRAGRRPWLGGVNQVDPTLVSACASRADPPTWEVVPGCRTSGRRGSRAYGVEDALSRGPDRLPRRASRRWPDRRPHRPTASRLRALRRSSSTARRSRRRPAARAEGRPRLRRSTPTPAHSCGRPGRTGRRSRSCSPPTATRRALAAMPRRTRARRTAEPAMRPAPRAAHGSGSDAAGSGVQSPRRGLLRDRGRPDARRAVRLGHPRSQPAAHRRGLAAAARAAQLRTGSRGRA